MDGLPNAKWNEGETDNKKAMIMVSFNDFSAPSESRMFIFWLFHQFATQLYTHASKAVFTLVSKSQQPKLLGEFCK